MPKVTVIIPAYNAETYIEKCADSVVQQTLSDIEIIFIDDGSTDRTGEILDGVAEHFSNVRVIHQENKGLYKSREIGCSLATGDYIGWVDADDYIELQMYEVLYQAAISNSSELVICDYSWFPAKIPTKEKWFREYKGKIDTTFIERNSQPWNKIVKRSLMEKMKVCSHFTDCFDEIYVRLLMEAHNPVTINKQLYHYRIGKNSMSSSYTNVAHYRSFVYASKELRKVMESTELNSYWREYFDYRVMYYLLITMIVAGNAGDKKAYQQNRKEFLTMRPGINQHYWKILRENYGFIKSIAIGAVAPMSYWIARIACLIGMR